MRPANPADRYFVPIVSCTIGDDEFTPENGLMEARVFLGEGERQSNCSFLVYDPDQEWADKYFKASYEQGGIEGLPPQKTGELSPGALGGNVSIGIAGLNDVQKTNAALITRIGKARGLNDNQIAAMIAGAMQESQLGTLNDEIGGFAGKGLFQLTDLEGQSGTWIGKGGIRSIQDYYDPEKNVRALMEDYAFPGWLQISANQSIEDAATSFAAEVLRPRSVGDKYAGKARALFPGGTTTGLINPVPESSPQPQVGGTPTNPATDGKPIKLPQPGDKKDILADVKLDATKEVSNKGQLIKIVMASDVGNSFEFVFTHIATSHEMHLNATEFSGASIRWEMNRRIKNTAYKDLTIRQLAQSIATNYGLKLDCPEDGPKFKYIDQTGISDYRLLQRECDRIGWRVYENGQTLVVEPRKNKQNILTLTYGRDIAKWKSEDRAQTDSVEQGRDFSQLSDRGSQGEAKTAIDTQRGEMIAEKPESKTGTGAGAIEATTGANVSPLAGLKADPPSEKKDILADVKLTDSSSADSAKRVKAFKSTMECPTSEALLGATLDQPVLTDGFKADFFNRMWVAGSIEHRYDGKLNTTLQLYTPLKPKPGITLGDSKLPQGEAVAVATGKILNPHSDGGVRGTPFDPSGTTINRRRSHRGIDTVGAYPIRAGFDGTVVDVLNTCTIGDYNCGGQFGNLVYIDGEGAWQGYTLRYAHLATGSVTVSIGQKVKAGQVIGQMGTTGGSSGDHLHMELLQNGNHIDPEPYISPCFTGVYGPDSGHPLKCGG